MTEVVVGTCVVVLCELVVVNNDELVPLVEAVVLVDGISVEVV